MRRLGVAVGHRPRHHGLISRFRRAARTPVATVTAWVRVVRARFWSAAAYAYLHALYRCSFMHVLILHAGCKHTSL